ncbi:MAG TPA: DUF4188 domain-containing protein [Natronosporangium sp.]
MSQPHRRPVRLTADLAGYPDLVVIYLGMRVRSPRGLLTLFKYGPRIRRSAAAKPDGLLRHEMLTWGLAPPHLGMRQYWRDFDSLERWARSDPHAAWWRELLSDMAGVGFWHETYLLRGGMESVYLDMPPVGFAGFAPAAEAKGSLFSARRRLRRGEDPAAEQRV